MTGDEEIRAELEPGIPEDEADALVQLARRLQIERPVPSAAFRGMLRRRLVGEDPPRGRPSRLRLLVAAYLGSGAVLLALAATGVAGAGPFGV